MYRPACKIQTKQLVSMRLWNFFTFYQDVSLMKILTPNGLKKLRSEKITYCLVNPVLKKFVTWEMRSSETDIFFLEKQVLKNFLPTLQKILQFHLISWCGNFVEKCSFRIVSGESHKTVGKLCLYLEFYKWEWLQISTRRFSWKTNWFSSFWFDHMIVYVLQTRTLVIYRLVCKQRTRLLVHLKFCESSFYIQKQFWWKHQVHSPCKSWDTGIWDNLQTGT